MNLSLYHMNGMEIGVYGVALIGLAVYLRFSLKSWRYAFLNSILTAVPLYLSIERTTQFYTFDETYIVPEIATFFKQAQLGRWIKIKLRTTILIQSTTASIVRTIWGSVSDHQIEMLMKGLHWLLGFASLILIHYLLQRFFLKGERLKAFSLVFFMGMLLLPNTSLGLKVLNADALSLHLGMAAGIIIVAAGQQRKASLAWIGVLLAYLAAQEKISLSPLIIPALGVLGYSYIREENSFQEALHISTRQILRGLTALIGLGLIFALIPAAVTGFQLIETAALLIISFGPLTGWAWPLFYLLGDITSAAFSIPPVLIVGLTIVTFAGAFAVSIGLWFLTYKIKLDKSKFKFPVWISTGVLALVILNIGLIGHYKISARLAPALLAESGFYQPTTSFNEFATHYGARTLAGHLAAHTAFVSGIFITGLPTVFWVGLAAAIWKFRKPSLHALQSGIILLIAGGFASVIAFGIMQLPPRITYLNISIFMVALGIILGLHQTLITLKPSLHYSVIALFSLLLLIEIIPFAPLYASFRPLWLNYGQEREQTQNPGYLDDLWPGWGEEMMLAGQIITQDDLPANHSNIHLYLPYVGAWLDTPKNVETDMIVFSEIEEEDLSYTEDDYYVISRVSLAYDFINQPFNVQPVSTIDFRGYRQAWIYRGDQLKAAGFTFHWQNPYEEVKPQ